MYMYMYMYMLINFPLIFLCTCTCIFTLYSVHTCTLYIVQVQLCIFSLQDLQREEPPSKYYRSKPPTQYDHSNPGSGSKAKKKTHTQLPRKVTRFPCDKIGPIADFNLRLVDYVVFGEATLAMCFSLSPTMTDRDKDFGQVLVVSVHNMSELHVQALPCLFVCLCLLLSFFLLSSLKNMYMYIHVNER